MHSIFVSLRFLRGGERGARLSSRAALGAKAFGARARGRAGGRASALFLRHRGRQVEVHDLLSFALAHGCESWSGEREVRMDTVVQVS